MADFSARAKFHLTGGDRVRFLNGQVTNDVRRASDRETLHACVLTPKGKMCGDIILSAGADFLRLDAEPQLREALSARLERYIISDDATLEDVTDETSIIHLFGIAGVPEPRPRVAILRSSRLGIPGFDLLMNKEHFPEVWESLELPVADGEMLELLRVEAGIPLWGRELTPDTLPVEAGLDKTAIDYAKGCYVGQEIVSRLKSVGHANKRLHGFVSREGPLEEGMRLFPEGEPAAEAGWLTSAVRSFGLEKYAALGYLKRGFEQQPLTARRPDANPGDGPPRHVDVRDLPLIQ
jgi:folate-binding protein YgfZ